MRMRAALTYRFGRLAARGNTDWSLGENGKWKGNPSMSLQVSRYMVSLRRRKVCREVYLHRLYSHFAQAQDGETTMSSRAITTSVLRDLYLVNSGTETSEIGSSQVDPKLGPRARRMLQVAYIVAFLCLLRFDEVLAIKFDDLRLLDGGNAIRLTLSHRKTSQYGGESNQALDANTSADIGLIGVKPFKMHKMPHDQAHLCPVRAIAYWMDAYGVKSGYLFPSFASKDRPRPGEHAMVSTSEAIDGLPSFRECSNIVMKSSEAFLRLFRRNLLEVHRDATPYGTHSFRRGGCQYFATELRWPLRRICDWGGWSLSLTHLTIVKYLISWNDDPLEPREDYLNPNRSPTVKCYSCGRSCHCG